MIDDAHLVQGYLEMIQQVGNGDTLDVEVISASVRQVISFLSNFIYLSCHVQRWKFWVAWLEIRSERDST